jgi:type I restriction enzyme, S subunit
MKNKLKGWKEFEIGKIAKCLDGDWILSKNMSDKKEIGIIQLKHIGKGKFLDKSYKFITKKTSNELKCTVLEEGDLLVSRMAEPICRSCILPKLRFQTVTSVDVTIIKPNEKLVEKEFLNIIFNSYIIKEQVPKYTTGTTRARISRKNLEKLKIPLPSLDSQKNIISIIKKSQKLNQMRKESDGLTKDFLEAIFLEMFVNVKKNKGWETKALDDICEQVTDIEHKMPKGTESGIPFVSVKDIATEEIDFSKTKYISKEDHIRLSKRCLPKKGDILYSRIGVKLGIARIVKVSKEFGISYSLCLIKSNKKMIDPVYLTYFLNSPLGKSQAESGTQSIGVPDLGMKVIKNFQILVPPMQMQEEFCLMIKQIDELRFNQNLVKENIDNLYNNLIQKIFKGELIC